MMNDILKLVEEFITKQQESKKWIAGIMNQDDVIKNFPNDRKVTTDTFFLGTSPVITDEQLDYIEMVANNFLMKFKL